jgi:hypothetical protein
MMPEEFTSRLRTLVETEDWQAAIDWYEAHYPQVRSLLSWEERGEIEGGAMNTAYGILERRRHREGAAEQVDAERELIPAA